MARFRIKEPESRPASNSDEKTEKPFGRGEHEADSCRKPLSGDKARALGPTKSIVVGCNANLLAGSLADGPSQGKTKDEALWEHRHFPFRAKPRSVPGLPLFQSILSASIVSTVAAISNLHLGTKATIPQAKILSKFSRSCKLRTCRLFTRLMLQHIHAASDRSSNLLA